MTPKNLTANSILDAMLEIDEKGIPSSRHSTEWSVVHKDKHYPPKYLVSIANKLITGEEWSPKKFSGGSETNQFLESLGFEIVKKGTQSKVIVFWWVNQNQTAKHEINGGYMWSPKRNKNAGYNQFYENMRLVDNGDIVFSYYDQHIQHLGIVQRPGVSGSKPSEFGKAGDYWSNEGWFVPVEWHRLSSPLSPKSFFDKLKSTLPEKYSPLNRDTGDGLQNYLSAVPEPMAKVILNQLGDLESDVVEQAQITGDNEDAVQLLDETVEKGILNNTAIDETERKALVNSRRGQGRFRQNLASIEKSCRVTGVTDPRLLRASHIKPWRSCADNHERLDGYNGFLLAPHIDLLFDRGYISFSDKGDLMISPRVDSEQLSLLNISSDPTLNVGSFTNEQKHYLKFHRAEVFLVNRK